jgi:hypothetical protein
MEKKLTCVHVSKNANGTATATFHEKDDKGKVVFAMSVMATDPVQVDEFGHMQEHTIAIKNLMAKVSTPVQ